MENLLQDISFESTYMKYCNMLISNCCYMGAKNRYDAEEIVDDVFALLYIKWNSLESHAESVVLKWLNITLRNVTYSYVRRKTNKPERLPKRKGKHLFSAPKRNRLVPMRNTIGFLKSSMQK